MGWKSYFAMSLHQRWVITFMAFLANLVCYCMRGTFGLALVQMVAHKVNANTTDIAHEDKDTCPPPNDTSADSAYMQGDFAWDSITEGQILSSFYYGYLITQIPSGYLSGFIGAKILFAIGMGATGVFTLLAPVAARSSNGPAALSGIRALAGLAQGICFPLLPAIFGRWAPPQERTKILSIAAAGTQAGTVLGNIICGYVGKAYGWEYMFYLFGAIGIAFVVPWMLFVFDSPEHHPHITAMERSYIISSIGAPAMGNQASKVPWMAVIRSMPFWALVVVCWCSDWGFYTLLSNVPLYLRDVLHFSLTDNAVMSSIPYIVMWLTVVSLSPLGDYIISRQKMTVTNFRKTATVLGLVIPGIFLLMIPAAGCDSDGIIALLTMAIGMTGISTLGFRVNFNDISPSHAGLLYAICNTISTVTGIIGPTVSGVLTQGADAHRISAWYKIFIISAVLYFVAAVFYAFFASGELQNWDNRTSKSFSKNRIAPETAELLEGGVPLLPGEGKSRRKSSVTPWIAPTPDSQPVIAMDGTLETRQERRRSSLAAASQLQQRRRSSMATTHLAEFQALHALGGIQEESSVNSVVPTEVLPLTTIPEDPSTVNA